MSDAEQTPTQPPQQPPQQPGAPMKKKKPALDRQPLDRRPLDRQPSVSPRELQELRDVHAAWARFTGGMATMPVSQARRLRPEDIGVHLGPVMDEAQFEAYRRAQAGNVRVLK